MCEGHNGLHNVECSNKSLREHVIHVCELLFLQFAKMLSHLHLASSLVKKYYVVCSSVEISSSLAKKQLETVGEVGSHLSKFKVERRDAADRSGWGIIL